MIIRWRLQWLELLGITEQNIIENSKLYHLIHFFLEKNIFVNIAKQSEKKYLYKIQINFIRIRN